MLKVVVGLPLVALMFAALYFGFRGIPVKSVLLEKDIPTQQFPS